MTICRTSVILLSALCLCLCASAVCQIAVDRIPVVPNQGTLAGAVTPAPDPLQPDLSVPGAPTLEAPAVSVPDASALADPVDPMARGVEDAVAGRKIPSADRDQFRARFGLESDRQRMRQSLSAAARERIGRPGALAKRERRSTWRDWRHYRHDSLDGLLHGPRSIEPYGAGARMRGLERWGGPAADPDSRWWGRTLQPPPFRPEYQGPWPWEQGQGEPPAAVPQEGETIRSL